jgi:hypothetical protein
MLASTLPGIFPVVASGALLRVMGQGLQFASVVALTVSFGLGLSATIHFLNRLRLEDEPGQDPGTQRATILVGPALILTSVVLACGLVVTVFSDLPSLRLFGWLSAFAMMAALIADLFKTLRPTATFLLRLARRAAYIDTAVTSEAPCGLIVTDCLSPCVPTSTRAVKPAPAISAPVAWPDTYPDKPRVVSAQEPESEPPSEMTLLLISTL